MFLVESLAFREDDHFPEDQPSLREKRRKSPKPRKSLLELLLSKKSRCRSHASLENSDLREVLRKKKKRRGTLRRRIGGGVTYSGSHS